MKKGGSFTFGGKEYKFIDYATGFKTVSFLISDDVELNEIDLISDNIKIKFISATPRVEKLEHKNCMLIKKFDDTNIPGLIELKFGINIPIEEIREIKLKKLLENKLN